MFSKKAIKFEKIFTVDLTLCSKCQIDGEDFVDFCATSFYHFQQWRIASYFKITLLKLKQYRLDKLDKPDHFHYPDRSWSGNSVKSMKSWKSFFKYR